MRRLISMGEVRLAFRLIVKQPILMPATIFLTLAIAGVVACWFPAQRALSIRPSQALSADRDDWGQTPKFAPSWG